MKICPGSEEEVKDKFLDLPGIAQEKPVVVLFCWERYNLFKMALPRIVNATRRIGGYLLVIDDASRDERIPWLLDRYLDEGYVDAVFYGSKSRFIDWSPNHGGWGSTLARRSVIMHLMTKRNAPMVIFCDPDMVLAPDALGTLLTSTRVAREANIPASCYSGFRYNMDVFRGAEKIVQGCSYRMMGPYVSMALSLVTCDTSRRVEGESPSDFRGRWSLNEYAEWATKIGLQACYLMDVKSQHIGIGITGRSFTSEKTDYPNPFAFNEDGSPMEIEGFDVLRFLRVSNETLVSIQTFAYDDKVEIEEPRTVHPEFFKLKDMIRD